MKQYHIIKLRNSRDSLFIDYDLGKSGFAYYDLDSADYNLSAGSFQAWNRMEIQNDGVDIETNNDSKVWLSHRFCW